MIQVQFLDRVPDEKIQFAVIAARYKEQWILCRHRQRSTWEIPGGHREAGETPEQAARRELWEETGAADFVLESIGPYSVTQNGETSYGHLFLARVNRLDSLPAHMEMEERLFCDQLPPQLTYPHIQPALHTRAEAFLNRASGNSKKQS